MRNRRLLIAFVGGLIALNVVLEVIGSFAGSTPGGPTSSSYATGGDGAAAYAQLLRDAGHPVRALRSPPGDVRLDRGETIVLLDATGVTRADTEALRLFVLGGGRLVTAGPAVKWLESLDPAGPKWIASGEKVVTPVAPASETSSVSRVETRGLGSWDRTGAALPLLTGDRRAVLAGRALGKGRIVLLADASPLQNALLANADNAALGIGLVGERGRPVRFAESYHGYEEASGLAAIPGRWWAAMMLAVAAVIALMLMRGRRFGPPEPDERELPPSRAEYVTSLAAALAKRHDRSFVGVALADRMARRRLLVGDLVEGEAVEPPKRVVDDETLVAAGRSFAEFERAMRRG